MKTYKIPPRIIFAALCASLCAIVTRADVSVTIGTLQPGESVTITYDVIIDNPVAPGTTQIASQGTVSGSNFSTVNTDDPETTTANDATVTPLQNDAPVVTAGNTSFYTEQGSAAPVSPGLLVTDDDSPNLASATVSISSGFVSGDQLGLGDQNGITGNYDPNTGLLTLSGSSSVANYQDALRSAVFFSTSDDPTATGANPTRTITFVVNDGSASSAPATSTINVTGVNDPPVLSGGGNTIAYTENGAPIPLSPLLTVTDDSPNLNNALVFIQDGLVAGDLLGFVNQNGITGNYDGNSGALSLTGSASVANYQTALRSVTFSSSSENPTASGSKPTRTVIFVAIDDASAPSAPATTSVDVTGVNDNPVAVDDTILRGANDDVKVLIATLLANDTDPEGDLISFTGVNSPSAGGATVSSSGAWVYYRHNGTTADTFTYTISDGHGGIATGTVQVNIQDPNAQAGPVLTPGVDGSGAHVTFEALPGKTYTMQKAANPAGPWADNGTATESSPGHYTYTDGAGSPANFYRAVYR